MPASQILASSTLSQRASISRAVVDLSLEETKSWLSGESVRCLFPSEVREELPPADRTLAYSTVCLRGRLYTSPNQSWDGCPPFRPKNRMNFTEEIEDVRLRHDIVRITSNNLVRPPQEILYYCGFCHFIWPFLQNAGNFNNPTEQPG